MRGRAGFNVLKTSGKEGHYIDGGNLRGGMLEIFNIATGTVTKPKFKLHGQIDLAKSWGRVGFSADP